MVVSDLSCGTNIYIDVMFMCVGGGRVGVCISLVCREEEEGRCVFECVDGCYCYRCESKEAQPVDPHGCC